MSTSNAEGFALQGTPYHVGFVVADLDEAEKHWAVLGYEFGERIGADTATTLADGEHVLSFAAVYSRTGPIRIELVKEIRGTLWTAGNGLHHLGYFSDDVAGESEALVAAGYPVVAALRPDPAGAVAITMHAGLQGSYIELVDRSLQPFLEASWA